MIGDPPQVVLLDNGRRLHLHHGPIDLIIEQQDPLAPQAYERAAKRFETLLSSLVTELPLLRRATAAGHQFADPVAGRMQRATEKFLPAFVTPMASVAGAVADEILAAMTCSPATGKTYVNNGGDCAFHIPPGDHFKLAVAASIPAMIEVPATAGIRGVATSGWGGRSFSLGIADSVTVLAETAAQADAAATLLANTVDLPGHPAIHRVPASALAPDSDLGDRLVTRQVAPLSKDEIAMALDGGRQLAAQMAQRGLIAAALITLQGAARVVGDDSLITHAQGIK